MSSYQIIKQDDGRFALYQDEVLINTYTRKDSAVRRMKKLQSVVVVVSIEPEQQNLALYVGKQEMESELNFAFSSAGKVSFYLNKISKIFSESYLISEVQAHALTQRVERGAAHGVARSPP